LKNILSYKFGTLFTGAEILAWARYQINNKTSHFKHGKRILKLYSKTLKDDRQYIVFPSYGSCGCSDWIYKPLVVRKEKASGVGKIIH
jgi:hypothetical protein